MCFSLALFTWLFSCQYSSRWAGSANGGFILCVPHRQGHSIIRFNPPIVTRNSCWKKCPWKFFAAANTLHLSLTRTLFLSHTLSIYANELCNWFDKISVKRRRVGGWEQNKAIYSIVSWQQQLVSLEWVFLLFTISIEWSRKRSLRNQQGSFNREYDYENRIYNVCHHGHVTLLRQITPCLLWNQSNEKIMH